jgi:hypothetical protein
MTATIAQQIDRIQSLYQDTDSQAYSRNIVLLQHQDEIGRLAREERMGDILVLNAITAQALYTLPDSTVSVAQVLYSGQRLDYATEEFLDRKYASWEWNESDEPKYWTVNNQNPNTLRIVPAPLRTGSTVPIIPPAPFIMTQVDNLVVFLYRDFADQANDEVDQFPLRDIWEDVCVWRTVADLSQREGPFQNLPLAQTAEAMAELWLQLLEQ